MHPEIRESLAAAFVKELGPHTDAPHVAEGLALRLADVAMAVYAQRAAVNPDDYVGDKGW